MPLKFILNDRQCESCTAALDGTVKVRLGPFMQIDTKGGERSFAALCLEVRFELLCATTLDVPVTPP
jgi:hypothetical protein